MGVVGAATEAEVGDGRGKLEVGVLMYVLIVVFGLQVVIALMYDFRDTWWKTASARVVGAKWK